ncbi:hypothetical protein [Halococcus sediminicola]|uniref:hypothetical protein n=1 Tax=Halococcus sediminicola TaxID=1264579 RepID=UPI000A97837D|nr:hypothetical protein [Halococcus sediminicola]
MFDELTPTCEATDCDHELAAPALVFRDRYGERRAYECACGAITVTVAKTHA